MVALAAIFSASGKKAPSQLSAAQHEPPQPAIQDSTDNNVQDLKNQLAAERQKEAQAAAASAPQMPETALPNGTLAQQTTAAAYGPTGQPALCTPGQPCTQQQNAYVQQLSPQQQQTEQLAAKERELAYNARFASNLVYARSTDGQAASPSDSIAHANSGALPATNQAASGQPASNLASASQTSQQKSNPTDQPSAKRNSEVNIDSAEGQPYVVDEGLTMDTILMNRLDGDAVGPVKVLVSSPVYSHDRQHVLIPDGTIVLGEARKIGSGGFGQQRRSVPMDSYMAEDLLRWRRQSIYASDDDYVFASETMRGKQPYWPDNLMKRHIRPVAKANGIHKKIGWHTFRHSFGTLLKANGEDVKTVQELLRHANSRITLDVYTQAVNSNKRAAQSKVVKMIVSSEGTKVAGLGTTDSTKQAQNAG
ncbi:tyrosine-type recombinase/integrase [Edaphobacter aggregans]|uniref:tyrosine-type recombinase/integrase n=1 Tax=Edaphobacter aggregans TaxID=570835 RepID=UPI00068998AE|nr:tyrosine-type recombinase/integrase [Edaphobacter aggregans]